MLTAMASSGPSSPTSTITGTTSSTQVTLPMPRSSRVLLTEVIEVSEEGDVEFSGGGRVVRLGVCKDGVALLDEELAEVAEVEDDNLEALGAAKLMGELGLLGGVDGAHIEGFVGSEGGGGRDWIWRGMGRWRGG